MSTLLFPLAVPTVPILDAAERFPVGRIFCVGRNYAAHAKEMGMTERAPPFFFMKPAASLVVAGEDACAYPPDTDDLHHEVELVLALRNGGANIPEDQALLRVYGCAVGIDLTKRDRQAQLKDAGHPWERSKAFDGSAVIGAITPGAPPPSGAITLSVNGEGRQSGDIADMIWGPAEIITHLSRIWTLRSGDLIYTGTPAGVGALQRGDEVAAHVAGQASLGITIA
jgi:fumarylpyruvate hydrolase